MKRELLSKLPWGFQQEMLILALLKHNYMLGASGLPIGSIAHYCGLSGDLVDRYLNALLTHGLMSKVGDLYYPTESLDQGFRLSEHDSQHPCQHPCQNLRDLLNLLNLLNLRNDDEEDAWNEENESVAIYIMENLLPGSPGLMKSINNIQNQCI